MTDPRPPKSRRRRFVLSLRSLMLAVLVVGGLLGWKARRASIQRRAVAAVQAAGGSVQYDDQRKDLYSFDTNGQPWAPEWMRRAIGDEYFREVGHVYLPDRNANPAPGRISPDAFLSAVAGLDRLEWLQILDGGATDAGLAKLTSLGRLRALSLVGVAATDAGLAAVGDLTTLENLELHVDAKSGGRVGGAGVARLAGLVGLQRIVLTGVSLDRPADLAFLAKLPRMEMVDIERSPRDEACLDHVVGLTGLRALNLRDTELTDAGLARLAALPALNTLVARGSDVTDAGLARLGEFRELRNLHLTSLPRATNAGLSHLARSSGLQFLNLSDSKITDAGLVPLSRLDKLRFLMLERTAITDAGLEHLTRLPGLNHLWLEGTAITDAGLAAVLPRMRGLQRIYLFRTQVTPTGAIALRKAWPQIRIIIETPAP